MVMRMQSLNDDERREVMGEVLFDELQLIREYVEQIPGIKRDLQELKEGQQDIKI